MQHQKNITPVYHNVEDVGKNIKQTKKRFTWVIEMNQKMYTFVLDASMISGKVKLTCNNKVVAMSEEQPLGTFKHTMSLDTSEVIIMAAGDTYEMRINNQVFSHMMNQIKTKTEFVKNDQACEDFVVDEKILKSSVNENGLKKTIKLKIGSMKPTVKSSSKSVESEDWRKMIGEEMNSFPNYFDLQKGGSNQQHQEVDYSKISMKKKPVQTQTTKQEEPTNFLEENTQVIEITPEQFCTMQQLFRTQVQMQMPVPTTSEISAYESTPKQMHPSDFGTMQMLFQTQCGTQPKNISQSSTEPVEININVQDFSTMQWMFNTMNLGVPQNTSVQITPQVQAPKASLLLDELCQTTTTQTQAQSSPSFNMADFSTMQMMFATNNMNISNSLPMPKNPMSEITVNQSSEVKSQISNQVEPNPLDFNTMVNMFKTMNFSQPQTMGPSTELPTSDPLACLSLSNSSNNANIQNINMSDFSTMQNLFKTNGMGSFSTMMQKPQNSSSELKQNSVPFQFQF